jgi:hypothetical protein
MSKHTPGPWYSVIPTGDTPRNDSWLCIANEESGNIRATESDFRLISAAPEMYDALHVAAGALAALLGTENQAFKIVAAAISKADRK